MSINGGMFTSDRKDWETPDEFFGKVDDSYGPFDLDVCASRENRKAPAYFDENDDGLSQDWGQRRCWMNPPFGDAEHACRPNCKKKRCVKRGHHVDRYVPGIADWVRKAYDAAQNGATVVCLLPARTCSSWWHDYVMKGEVRLLRGRLTFVGAAYNAPFPCALVVFRPPL